MRNLEGVTFHQSAMLLPGRHALPQPSRAVIDLSDPESPDAAPPADDAAPDEAVLAILDRLGCGGVVRDGTGRLLAINKTARHLLLRGPNTARTQPCSTGSAENAINRVLNSALVQLNTTGRPWVTIDRDDGRPIVLYQLGRPGPEGRVVVVVVDLGCSPAPSIATLRRMFGLTNAEARLAQAIAQGNSPADLAGLLKVSRTTVRSHLAAIFAKTETRTQGKLVALLARMAVLP